MDETKSIFSGSEVLRFIDTADGSPDWSAADLDIYTTSPEGERVLEHFEQQGYHASVQEGNGETERPYADSTGVACVVHLLKPPRKVDVVFSTNHSAITPVAHFWSTLVCNIVTAHSIYVAYPKSTLRRKGYKRPWAAKTAAVEEAERKYVARGYIVERFTANSEASDGTPEAPYYCPHNPRHFGDDGTLVERYRARDICTSHGNCIEDELRRVLWTWGGQSCACCIRDSQQSVQFV